MKLAKALQLRKQLGRSLEMLARRIQADSVRQPDYQGKLPAQVNDPNKLVRDLISTSEKLAELITAINTANNTVQVTVGDKTMTLGRIVVTRDQKLKLSQQLAELGQIRARGAGAVLDLDAKLTETVANQLAREARELDDLIQQTNWQFDIEAPVDTSALPESPTGDPDDDDDDDADDSWED